MNKCNILIGRFQPMTKRRTSQVRRTGHERDWKSYYVFDDRNQGAEIGPKSIRFHPLCFYLYIRMPLKTIKNSGFTLINNTHSDEKKNKRYLIDFPHMACPLGASAKSDDKKEVTKFFAGLPFLKQEKINFLFKFIHR